VDATVVYVAFHSPAIDVRWIPDDVQVIIVVNGGERPAVRPADRRVTWIEPDANLGFGAGVNLAASDATGDRLVLVNPDSELRPEHWGPLASGAPDEVVTIPLSSHGVATTVVSRYPGAFQHVAGALRLRARLRERLGQTSLASPTGGLGAGQRAELTTHWASGACVSVDATRFRSVGGFSPSYFLYYEDMDLCARLARRHPGMTAVVADVLPGDHAVAASAHASAGRAEVERARSATTYAAGQVGIRWRAASAVCRVHAGRVARRDSTAPARGAPRAVDVVVVSLGRTSSRGERRRARSWLEIAAVHGGTGVELRLLDAVRWAGPIELARKVTAVATGRLVPETLAWSTRRAATRLASLRPSTVVVLTSRAYDTGLQVAGADVILDYVDRLSDSYHDRSTAAGTGLLARLAWRGLAACQLRFERSSPLADRTVAAGLGDAQLLAVEYVPIVATVAVSEPCRHPTHDLAFVGNLRYPPNVEAVHELDAMWPALVAARPLLRMLLAGATPHPDVGAIAVRNGWTLDADFDDERSVYQRAAIAVAPLTHASGIQTKVIDALRHAVPVVAYPPAAAGFATSIPVVLADDRADFVAQVVALVDDDDRRIELGRRSASWVADELDPARWTWALAPLPQDDR
jgi:hypothetical protein